MKAINLTAMEFGRLSVIADAGIDSRGEKRWRCVCKCGNETTVLGSHLRSGRVVSCGCYSAEQSAKRKLIHGMFGSKIYSVWNGMVRRCYDVKNISFWNYGGRGIKVCDRWKDFSNFHKDMGDVPEGMSIDRIDTNGNYEPSNCRWATSKEQQRNKRTNRIVEQNGKNVPMVEALENIGVARHAVNNLVKRKGLSHQEAVNELGRK